MSISRHTNGTSNGQVTVGLMKVRIPQHVVYRSLASETVVLNVQTGIYYGLNTTAGRMLEVLDRVGDLDTAIPVLAEEFEISTDTLRSDLLGLCEDLEQKGVLEVETNQGVE